uniref:IP14766p n=1 Tax=Drosophila melanogaster TaxID=7227 RepID=Q3KN37_DROME|nr:IP14766p [Drosophila melanogaster]
MDAKEEGLPQCKIKRNYSCNHCAYFTQNPRYHLTHLRDVHGEKIVINKCKLCLYASRHFQKLVRHMKMVHGCTDGIPSGHGQARGKRGMSREARKRRLEESVGVMGGQSLTVTVPDVPTLEQVKRELLLQEEKLQRDIQAFNQRQREEQQREQQRELELVATSAYERQMQVLRDYERQSPAEPPTPSPTSGSATPPSNGEEPQNRLLKCSACEFTTLYRTQLRAHELAEHGKTKFFRCDKCSYVTHIKARFSKHVKYHSMPMIKCVTCDFRTPYKWNLDRHMKNHGGAGAFKCAACDFTADIKQSLTVHEMNHHVPPVGNAGSIWPRRQNKVGASEMCEDFLSDSAELEDQYNNNNVDDELDGVDDADEAMSGGEEQPLHLHHYGNTDNS